MADKRGARSKRRQENERRRQQKAVRESSGWRLWLRRIVVWGGSGALIGAFALGCAIFFAARSMPSFATLMGSQNGQTIVAHKEIPGITGGALDSQEGLPGPIYLQGDQDLKSVV